MKKHIKIINSIEAYNFLKTSARLHKETIADFCKKIGISRTTAWRWKNMVCAPDMAILSKIQKANDLLKERKL